MRYVLARHNNEMRDMTYRIFISDELFYLNNNVVQMTGGTQVRMHLRDLYYPQKEDDRTPEDIIAGLKEKMRRLK